MATKIYVDQGHNPVNPNAGAEGSGLREQDVVYKIGRELADRLRSAGYEVRLSRPTADTQLGNSNATSLRARVDGANSWGADYFISLHTNAATTPGATGTEALVYSSPSRAATLARDILAKIASKTGLRNRGIVVRSGLYVLRKTKMPAVLLEIGFISNPNDAKLMSERPDLIAEAITEGVIAYTGGPRR